MTPPPKWSSEPLSKTGIYWAIMVDSVAQVITVGEEVALVKDEDGDLEDLEVLYVRSLYNGNAPKWKIEDIVCWLGPLPCAPP